MRNQLWTLTSPVVHCKSVKTSNVRLQDCSYMAWVTSSFVCTGIDGLFSRSGSRSSYRSYRSSSSYRSYPSYRSPRTQTKRPTPSSRSRGTPATQSNRQTPATSSNKQTTAQSSDRGVTATPSDRQTPATSFNKQTQVTSSLNQRTGIMPSKMYISITQHWIYLINFMPSQVSTMMGSHVGS